jgi:hypothetical protein
MSQAIKFGRWLLLHATPAWEGNLLCWEYLGKNYNTAEIYKIFVDEKGL